MKRFALIGEKLGHSYSKLIHERYFELSSKAAYTYDLIEIPRGCLKEEFDVISNRYSGVNVTIPYKLDVMEFLDYVSPEAKKIGAVNTVKFMSGRAEGYNTDYFGFKHTLEVNDISVRDKSVVILGTGGASKAVLAVCEDMCAGKITFVSTSSKKIKDYEVLSYSDDIKGDIIINCTPVGMYPDIDKSPLSKLSQGTQAVVDLIYNPSVTGFMYMAEQNGAKAVNGLYMLVSQAMHSECIWNGEDAAKGITDAIYKELKAQFDQPIRIM